MTPVVLLVAGACAQADPPKVEADGFRIVLKSARQSQRSRPTIFADDAPAVARADLSLRFEIAPLAPNEGCIVEMGQLFRGRLPDGKAFDGHTQGSHMGMGMSMSQGPSSEVRLGKFGLGPSENRPRAVDPNAPVAEAGLVVEPTFVGAAPTRLAELECEFFASKLELFDFEFPRADFIVNAVKNVGAARLKLLMIDEHGSGCRLAVKLDMPRRSEARSVGLPDRMAGFMSSSSTPRLECLVFVRVANGGFKSLALGANSGYTSISSRRWSDPTPHGDPLMSRSERHVVAAPLPKDYAAVHFVFYRMLDYPRLHKFKLKDVKIEPAPPRPVPLGRKQIAQAGG